MSSSSAPQWLTVSGASRESGLIQLRAFTSEVTRYGAKRNFVDAESSGVSQLSPWTNKGLLSEAEVSEVVLHERKFSSIEKFLQEVYWRRYWRGYLSHRPQIWETYRKRVAELSGETSEREKIARIIQGECDVEIMGYFARQLIQTGYMHNHARMWFAAWWIHVENLPWELGADFFLRHLIDGDPAVNTLSWRWVAGLHTQGKNYLARRSNIEKYVHPDLLGQYSGGLERLENPIAAPQREFVSNLSPVISEEEGILDLAFSNSASETLAVFADDLDIDRSIAGLKTKGVQVSKLYLLHDSSLDLEFSLQKAQWNKNSRDAVTSHLESLGIQVHQVDLNSKLASDAIIVPYILQRPEVGYYTESYQQLLTQSEEVLPYYDEEKETLNSYAKAGFFTYWKKTKKCLFNDV